LRFTLVCLSLFQKLRNVNILEELLRNLIVRYARVERIVNRWREGEWREGEMSIGRDEYTKR
tara:strand:- start:7 stop:192 length:186 start_codon:yes stop_codon:yes gene_type:complete